MYRAALPYRMSSASLIFFSLALNSFNVNCVVPTIPGNYNDEMEKKITASIVAAAIAVEIRLPYQGVLPHNEVDASSPAAGEDIPSIDSPCPQRDFRSDSGD